MKFGQLMEHDMRNNFLEKPCTRYGGETSPRLFSKNAKLSITLDHQSKVLYYLFLLYAYFEGYKNILKLRCRSLSFTSYKAFFWRKKEVWN